MQADQFYRCTICGQQTELSHYKMNNYDLYRCIFCDFYFAPESFADIPDYNSAYSSPAYIRNQVDALRRTKDKKSFCRIPTYSAFFENVRFEKTRTLLDVGCGVGRFCHAAYAVGYLATGIDVSLKAIEIAGESTPFPMFCKSIDNIIAEACCYDIVTAFEVIEHIAEPLAFIRQIKKALAKGGEFFFTVPNWSCPTVRNSNNYDAVPPYHINFFTQRSCQVLLEKCGFKDVRTGIIYVDPIPEKIKSFPKWIFRRMTGKRRDLGLWASGIVEK